MSVCREFAKDLGPLSRTTSLVHLRLLATSDLHASLMPYDYYADRRDDGVGLVRVAGLIAAAREETSNCILLDNGDTFQGGPLGELAARDMREGNGPHAMVAAMNALGYDAATLGNHDFDYGLDLLGDILSGARFPVVLANARWSAGGAPYKRRFVLLERTMDDLDGCPHRLRIGITGTVPPQVAHWNRNVLKGALSFTDAVAATADAARRLRALGADIVVALAHTGLESEEDIAQAPHASAAQRTCAENVAHAVAALPEVDVVIAGHTHEVYPPRRAVGLLPPATPIVQPGFWGSHLGCVDLALVRDARAAPGHGGWSLRKAHSEAIPVRRGASGLSPAPLRRVLRGNAGLRRQIGAKHRATRAFTARAIGETSVPLHTYFSLLAPCAATQIVSDAQRAAARSAIAPHPGLRDLPLLSAVAPMRCGGRAGPLHYTDVPPGQLRVRHVADLYCYPNHLAVLRLHGRDLAAWLERSASLYRRIDPDDPAEQDLIDKGAASYNFDRIDGLTYDIDVSVPSHAGAAAGTASAPSGRIRNLRHADGRTIDPQEEVLVATNSYRAAGGGNFDVCVRAETIHADTTEVRDHVIDFVRRSDQPISPVAHRTFRLTGFGKARVVYTTGRGALRHPRAIAELGLVPLPARSTDLHRFLVTG